MSNLFRANRRLWNDRSDVTRAHICMLYLLHIQLGHSLSLSQAGVDNNILMRVAVFQVFPLELVGMLEINKKVISAL